MNRRLDLSWAAGLIEGEGSIRIVALYRKGKTPGYAYISDLSVGMTDQQCIRELERLFGGTVIFRKKKPPHRDAWQWQVSSRRGSEVIAELLPFFRCDRVKEKACLAVEFQAQKRYGGRSIIGYSETQLDFFERMRELNKRGRDEAK